MATCGWCGTENRGPRTNCVNCGGPLPVPPGREIGEPPPPVPRQLPARYRYRILIFRNFGLLFGSIFGGIGCLIMVIFTALVVVLPPIGLGACLGAVFAAIGIPIAVIGVRRALRDMAVLRTGVPAEGTVVAVGSDMSTVVNGRHPWLITYTFEAQGQLTGGEVTGMDPVLAHISEGDKMWIIYDPSDPEDSCPWPPIS